MDKSLDDILDKASLESLKNRVLLSKVKKRTNTGTLHKGSFDNTPRESNFSGGSFGSKESIYITEGDHLGTQSIGSRAQSTGLIGNMINGMKQPSSYYAFLICQKPITRVDEEYFLFDDEVLESNVLVDPIEYNRIYLFTYRSVGDSSPIKKVLPVEQITSLLAKEYHGEYKLKIEMADQKKYSLVFQCAYECLNWVRGLRKCIQIQEEILRSNYGLIKYNISILYKQYESRELELIFEVVDALFADLVLKLGVDEFLARLLETIREINFFCDAFFAFKPFISNFFEIIIKRVHLAMRARICEFWNLRFREMNTGEILSFGKHANSYREMIGQWGLLDEKYNQFNAPVVLTFCSQLFETSQEIMFNVVEEAMFKFKKEKSIFRNDSTKILEAHMNILFENYSQFPTLETARFLTILVANIVGIVQMNIIIQIQRKKRSIENEVLASLTNNTFESLIRNFVKKVHLKTKSELSLKQIRELINYHYLLRNNERISHVCLQKLNRRVLEEIKDLFHSQRRDFLTFRVDNLLRQIDLLYRDIIFGFHYEFDKHNFVETIGGRLVRLYTQKLMIYLPHVSKDNYVGVMDKLEGDRVKLLAFFRPLVSKELDPTFDILAQFESFFRTNDTDTIRTILFKLIAFFGVDFLHQQHMEQILKAKIYFSGRQIDRFIGEFERVYSEKGAKPGDAITRQSRSILSQFKIRRIARKLKAAIQKKKEDRFQTNLEGYKSNTEQLLYKSFLIDDIFLMRADCKMIKFPESIEDLEIETFVDNYLKRGSM